MSSKRVREGGYITPPEWRSMVTMLKNDKTGKTLKVQTQQYTIGTYVIIDDDPNQQFGLDIDEKQYHEDIKNGKVFKKCWKVIV